MQLEKVYKDFYINTNNIKTKKERKISYPSAIGSLAGTLLPVFLISKIRKGRMGFDVFESGSYGKDLLTVVSVSTGGVIGGLLGAMTQKPSKEDRRAKYAESVNHVLNVAFPATIAIGILSLAKKLNYKGFAAKFFAPVLGIGLGMFLSKKSSNLIDEKIINRDNPNYKSNAKIDLKDFIVHIDDILSLAVITKIPFASKIHADKILPFVYAWNGYESSSAKANDLSGPLKALAFNAKKSV